MRNICSVAKIVFLLLVLLGISSCKKDVNHTPSGPRTALGQYSGFTISAYTLLKVSGDNQSDTINTQLSLPLKVQVQDSLGAPYPNEEVTFVVSSGGGSLSSTTVTTDVNGYAETFWTLGSTTGTQSVSASANVSSGSPVSFTATAIGLSGTPVAYTLLKISGDNQSDTINSQLNQPLKVQIQDSIGSPYSGEQVIFTVTNGGGNLSTTTVTTDVNGYAETIWTLGSIVGAQSVSVSANVPNGSPVSFTATAISNILTAHSLLRISGDNQISTINSQLSTPLKVQVKNSSGGAFSGEQVIFTITGGGGNLSAITVMTDANGFAETYWTLGGLLGAQSVSASANVPNGSPVTFTATAIATSSTSTMTDSRDGNVYATVTIGNQIWMAENLRYNASGSWLNSSNPSTKYGRLYSWTTLMNGYSSSSSSPSGEQGICPPGWHVPSDAEWNKLEMALGMNSSDTAAIGWRGGHGFIMKSTTGWINNYNGTNILGFNVFPAGVYQTNGFFGNLGWWAYFWTSTENSSTNGFYRYFLGSTLGVSRGYYDKIQGNSCRCVKN